MCVQYFIVVFGQGEDSFNYYIYSLVNSTGSQPKGRSSPKGHKINLVGWEMINEDTWRKTEVLSYIIINLLLVNVH